MKANRQSRAPSGLVALPMVTTVGMILLVSMWVFFVMTSQQQQIQADVELRTDFHQREQAFTRALLVILPNKMIGCMKANSNSQASLYSWTEVFNEAISMAQSQQSSQSSKWSDLGINGARSANPGDGGTITVTPLVPITTSSGLAAQVNSGTTKYYGALSAAYPASFPEPLNTIDSSLMDDDCVYPLITTSKQYTTNSTGLLQASVSSYPLYNLMAYPQVLFPLTTPGNPFVAKRNWWAFSVTFTSAPQNGRLSKSITKNYVLSAYEIPSQLPISSNAATILGQHADGSSWNTVNKVMGTVYGDSLQTDSGFNWQGVSSALQPGAISRQGMASSSSAQSTFSWMNPNFDSLGTLEIWQATNNEQVGQLGVTGDAGRTAFIPISPTSGTVFNQQTSYASSPNSVSPTLWDVYSSGANQCCMTVQVVGVTNVSSQAYIPTDLQITCLNAAGTGKISIIITRDQNKASTTPGYVYWPQASQDSTQPFQTEQLTDVNGNPVCGLMFMPGNLESWLSTTFSGSAAGINGTSATTPLNNKIYFEWVSSISQTQTSAYQTGVVLSDPASDLTRFNWGLSIVAATPVYVESDLNNTPDTQRAISDPNHPYPPLSVYGYDIFVGTKTVVQELVLTNGQLASMNNSTQGTGAYYPLDIKSFATNQALPDAEIQLGDPDNPSSTGLIQIVNPSELPPITQMNWLLTLDEVHSP